jgi:hypothetical protein
MHTYVPAFSANSSNIWKKYNGITFSQTIKIHPQQNIPLTALRAGSWKVKVNVHVVEVN